MISFLLSNWKAKLGSFFVAVVLYANLQNSKVLQKTINVTIDYPKLSPNLYYADTPEKAIPVRVEGLRDAVNYYSQFMKATIDTDNLQIGENEVAIKKIQGIPNGVKVTKLKDSIKVVIESSVQKTVPLEIGFDGLLPPDMEKTSFTLQPNKITIAGKSSEIEKITKIQLPSISLEDKKESFFKKIKIPDLGKGIQNVERVRETTLSVNLLQSGFNGGEQTVVGIPIQCVGTSKYLIPELSEEQISLRFFSSRPYKSLQILNGIQAFVTCNATFDPGRGKILPNNQPTPVKIRIQKSRELKNLEILQIKPEKVSLTYKIREYIRPEDETEDTAGEGNRELLDEPEAEISPKSSFKTSPQSMGEN